MPSISNEVAIIGAGLAGCALALSLHQHSISVRIYESRPATAPEISSGVILTPNGLRILDELGVYARFRDTCWLGEYRTYKDDRDETTRKVRVAGPELYGYANHRVWRRVLLAEMRTMLRERGVEIYYECRFEGVLCEVDGGGGDDDVDDDDEKAGERNGEVIFEINGKEERANMLIGADGIYSTVRKYLDPDMKPEYTGVMGIISHIKRSMVQWPYEDFEKQCTIQGKPGALILMPEVKDGSEVMVAMQAKYPDQGRAGFEAMAKDSEFMTGFFRKDYDDWHDTAKKIIDSVCAHPEALYLWPYLKVPKMQQWFSNAGRVIIVGDAAHAVPPSSGQGVNQALEDIWTLTLLLKSGKDIKQALTFWQDMRQQRVDAVYDWATNATNVQRMPQAERLKIIQARKATDPNVVDSFDDMRWLYEPRSERMIEEWIQHH